MELTVKILSEHTRTDSDIAAAVLAAMKWNVFVPTTVTAKVERGIVTLAGQVHWNYQRDAAEHAVRYLTGVISVYNNILLKPENASVEKVNEKVGAALQRQATADAKSIHVEATGGKVTLSGHASSWQSIKDASWAAWAAPGVTEVVDKMTVSASGLRTTATTVLPSGRRRWICCEGRREAVVEIRANRLRGTCLADDAVVRAVLAVGRDCGAPSLQQGSSVAHRRPLKLSDAHLAVRPHPHEHFRELRQQAARRRRVEAGAVVRERQRELGLGVDEDCERKTGLFKEANVARLWAPLLS